MRAPSLPRGSQQERTVWYYSFTLAVLIIALCVPNIVHAITSLSQGYMSQSPLSLGSIVSLEKNSSDAVIAAATSNVDSLLGIVINKDSSLLAVTNSQKEQVQVATSGTTQVLVSDINGKIVRGDHITASPLSGVGMKATVNVRIIGVAQGNVANAKKQTYKNKAGKEYSVSIGNVPVNINVAYFFKEPEKTIVPTALQNVANSLAGKSVSTLPILLSMAIFLIMLIVASSLVYSMIRSSIISIGRNPMSQSAVYRDLIQISALVIAILAVGLLSIYFILTRL